jgi:hypothetical protein
LGDFGVRYFRSLLDTVTAHIGTGEKIPDNSIVLLAIIKKPATAQRFCE